MIGAGVPGTSCFLNVYQAAGSILGEVGTRRTKATIPATQEHFLPAHPRQD